MFPAGNSSVKVVVGKNPHLRFVNRRRYSNYFSRTVFQCNLKKGESFKHLT